MYHIDDGESTLHAGTLMQGDAPANQGYYFLGNTGNLLSLEDQVAILQGSLSAAAADVGDLRYIQSVGPITLRPGQATDLWVATVLGEDDAAFRTSVEAASDDIRLRRRFPALVAAADPTVGTPLGLAGTGQRSTAVSACRKECGIH